MDPEREGSGAVANAESSTVADMLRAQMEDRRRREEEIAEERRHREEERRVREEELAAERRRQDEEHAQRITEMREQMELLKQMVVESNKRENPDPKSQAAENTLKLTRLSDQDDVEAYLTTFERMMVAYEIKEARWAFKLAPQLTGKAQQAYATMPSAKAGDYQELKKAILVRYDINEETYRQRFRTAKPNNTETPRELVTRLRDTADKWLKGCKTAQEVVDMIVKEQLLNTLPEGVQVWVREHRPATSTEAGQLAMDYLQARETTPGTTPPDAERNDKTATGLPKKCQNCGRLGHLAHECRSRPNPPNGPVGMTAARGQGPNPERSMVRPPLRCFHCNQRGHMASQCPNNAALYCEEGEPKGQTTSPERQGVVYRRGMVEGVPVTDMLLDTGTTRTMVREDLVPPKKRVEGKVAIRCVHGDSVDYPLAVVQIGVGGQEFAVLAGVASTLPASMLLGRDVPELMQLLQNVTQRTEEESSHPRDDVLAVTTRAQARTQAQEVVRDPT